LKLANYERDGRIRAAIVHGQKLHDVKLPELDSVESVEQILDNSLIAALSKRADQLTSEKGVPISSVRLRSPVLYPEKIIMVAVNYGAHGKETNTPPPDYPYLFTKFRNAIIGPEDAILLPKSSKKVDWEVELAVVIGKEGKDIKKSKAYDYVAGYTISNDISYRDFQSQKNPSLGINWFKGKAMDASLPLGPWLVTRDEFPDPPALDISLTVNGKQQQHSNTKDMLIKVDELIAYASLGNTLKPGDIISTGTPDGVAAATGEPFLKDGDVVEAKISKIGSLRNPVKAG